MSEFFVTVPLVKLSTRAQPFQLTSDAAERAALAERFGLVEIGALSAAVDAARSGDGARVTGRLEARLVQRCVVSHEPLPVAVDADIAVDFVPFDSPGGDEVELSADALDTMPIEDGRINLGEAVAQTLLLALDPYPRASEERLAAARALILSEEDAARQEAAEKAAASPFAVLRPKDR